MPVESRHYGNLCMIHPFNMNQYQATFHNINLWR